SGYLISAGEVTSVGDVGGSTAGAAGAAGVAPFAQMSDGALDGSVQGDVYGLSLHGLFDSTAVRQALLAALYGRKGLAAPTDLAAIDYFEYKQQQYDILADGVRASLDMELLYSILDG
ncbi:MAG: hypothetical protein FWH50_02345, partial [Coriobacteriia bacterium]|nr:hypothetical protein [Coriobacteriia bacterium]